MQTTTPFPNEVIRLEMTNPDLDARQMAHNILYNAVSDLYQLMKAQNLNDRDMELFHILTKWVPFDYIARLSTMQNDAPLGR